MSPVELVDVIGPQKRHAHEAEHQPGGSDLRRHCLQYLPGSAPVIETIDARHTELHPGALGKERGKAAQDGKAEGDEEEAQRLELEQPPAEVRAIDGTLLK